MVSAMYGPDAKAWTCLRSTAGAFLAAWPYFDGDPSEHGQRHEIMAACAGGSNIPSITFAYHKKNYLLSRDYDLKVVFERPVSIDEDIDIKMAFGRKRHSFRIRRGGGKYAHSLAAALNSSGAEKLFERVEFTGLDIALRAGEQKAVITARTLFGSSTWLMIPPGFQYINPEKDECFHLLESLDFIGYLIRTC